ncbi:hypothetical protein [Limnospira maxima]|uniref:hypothetical protein n=1 Tax=Limnospira maxima TaxID=129910 RepID=UPI0009FBE84D|nr:hypothetical protein [Limnospira maxima]
MGAACQHISLPIVNDGSSQTFGFPNLLDGWQWSPLVVCSIAQDRTLRTYNGEDEMTKKTKNASPL